MNNHERVKLAFVGVKAPEGIVDKILNNAEYENPIKPRMLYRKSGLAVAAVVIILAALTTSALAYARVLDFSRIYAIVFGEKSELVEQYIEPFASDGDIASEGFGNQTFNQPEPTVNAPVTINAGTERTVIESEYDGIVLTLISAINDGDVLRIFATMQDTTGDRVSGSIHFDDWILSQGNGGNISVIDYDRATKTATLLITSLGGDHEGNATLNINGFTTNREIVEGLDENSINIHDILSSHAPQTIGLDEVWVTGGAARNPDGQVLFDYPTILGWDETNIGFSNVGWAYISNIGFVDGVLHIQTAWLSDTENQLLGISFINAENEVVYEGTLSLNFINGEEVYNDFYNEPYTRYKEMIYEDITDIEQLRELNIVIDFVEWGSNNDGSWVFSFSIPERATTEFMIGRELTIDGELVIIETVSLSPLGVIIDLPDNIAGQYRHEDFAYVIYSDGTIVELNETYIGGHDNESTLKFGGNIIEVERVRTIVINGEVVLVEPTG